MASRANAAHRRAAAANGATLLQKTPVTSIREAPDRFPVWIWMDVPCFYGFPVFGEPAVKVSWDRCEVFSDPDNRPVEADPATTQAIADFTGDHLPEALGPVRLAKTCL